MILMELLIEVKQDITKYQKKRFFLDRSAKKGDRNIE